MLPLRKVNQSNTLHCFRKIDETNDEINERLHRAAEASGAEASRSQDLAHKVHDVTTGNSSGDQSYRRRLSNNHILNICSKGLSASDVNAGSFTGISLAN